MKRIAFVISLLATTCSIFSGSIRAQNVIASPASSLLIEDFTYPSGSALTANGWTSHSAGGTNAIVTSAPSLTLTGYPGSGVGNAVALTTSGEDDNRTFAFQSSGTVYAATLVNVSAASQTGDYFFHLGPDPIGTTFRGRVFVKADASNNLAFGISKATTTVTDIAYTPFSYSLNTTYLIVVKYTIVTGTANDTVSLFVSTNVPTTEPAAAATATDIATQTDINPGTVSLRQGATASSPTLRVDGIRVGTSWQDVTQASVVHTQHVSDYNGDGKTDYAIVRNLGPTNGDQLQWWLLFNGTSTTGAVNWGISTADTTIPADFDGDGKTDVAVWRANGSESAFYILESQGNTFRAATFGLDGDDPSVVADYDGDGKADPAVFRSGASPGDQGWWYFLGSNNNPGGNITFVPWGTNGDFPAPGDYDGDGKADFVIVRDDGNGYAVFWSFQTTAGISSAYYGLASDLIVPGDYDGDGKTDMAVVRWGSGYYQWFYRPSSTGVISAAPAAVWGVNGADDIVQGDYDGDGKTDFAIFRSASSTFWVQTSGGSQFGVPWGQAGDVAPAAYNVR